MNGLPSASLSADFYGCRAALVWANERDVEAHRMAASIHSEDVTVAWLLLRGAVRIEHEREVVRATAGQWIFPAASPARQHFEPGSRIISLRFDLRLRGGEELFERRRDVILEAERYPELEPAARELVSELIAGGIEPGTTLVDRNRVPLEANFRIEAAFYAWLSAYVAAMRTVGEVPREMAARDERVTRILAFIANESPRDRLSEKMLARLAGLSVNQLSRLFVKETGLTPIQYRERIRLERARRALGGTTPVKQIAFHLGFSSSSHFSSWFTRLDGKSPRAFRQKRGDEALAT